MTVELTQSTESFLNTVCSCRGKSLETSTAENDALPCPEVRYLRGTCTLKVLVLSPAQVGAQSQSAHFFSQAGK